MSAFGKIGKKGKKDLKYFIGKKKISKKKKKKKKKKKLIDDDKLETWDNTKI